MLECYLCNVLIQEETRADWHLVLLGDVSVVLFAQGFKPLDLRADLINWTSTLIDSASLRNHTLCTHRLRVLNSVQYVVIEPGTK